MPRPAITSAQFDVRVNDQTDVPTARAMLVTLCCGARIYADTGLTICPTCDTPIGHVTQEIERSYAHLKHTSTRYWS
jgi:hypothetical protein